MTAPRARVLLPTAADAAVTGSPLWDAPAGLRSHAGIAVLLDLIAVESNAAQREPGRMAALAEAMHGDVIALSGAASGPVLRLLTVAALLTPTVNAIRSREVHDAYDWLARAMCDDWHPDGLPLWPDRIREAAHGSLGALRAGVLAPWLAALYDYDWKTAGLTAPAARLVPTAERFAVRRDPDALPLAGALLSWTAAQHPRDPARMAAGRRVANTVRAAAASPGSTRTERKDALMVLATCAANVTGDDPKQRARDVLDRFADLLRPDELLQAVASTCAGDADRAETELVRLTAAVVLLQAQIVRDVGQERAGWARGGMFAVLGPPLSALLRAGRVTPALRLLAAWQGVPADRPEQDRLLVGLRGAPEGFVWAADGAVAGAGEPGPVRQTELIAAYNDFASAAITVTGDPSGEGGGASLRRPARPGVPVDSASARMLQALSGFLRLPALVEAVGSNAGLRPEAMVLIPALPLPVQPLMVKEVGWTLPYSVSLARPLPDRPARTVLVWAGGPQTAEAEGDAVAGAFAAAGARVVRPDHVRMTSAAFVDSYRDGAFDVIWVGAHGFWSPHAPAEAALEMPDGSTVGLEELRLEHPGTGRRLLVLNACDSGASAHLGGLIDIGLSAAAAGPDQAVIAHLWPIGSGVVAPAFAAVLAPRLALGSSFFNAYTDACAVLASGADRVADDVRSRYVDQQRLLVALDDHPGLLESFAGWGSSAFLQ